MSFYPYKVHQVKYTVNELNLIFCAKNRIKIIIYRKTLFQVHCWAVMNSKWLNIYLHKDYDRRNRVYFHCCHGVLVQEMQPKVRPWKAPRKAKIDSFFPSPSFSFELYCSSAPTSSVPRSRFM